MKEKKYIWLFGENNSETCNNNSFYFWEHVVLNKDNIEKYFILTKNNKNKKKVKQLEKSKKKYVIWKNSIQHYLLYRKADMFFVSLSYKDISPTKILWRNINPKVIKPLIYLQHGTIAMKRLGYTGKGYNNNMFRFMIYNEKIIEQFKKENKFKDYQIYYSKYHPRYKELLKRQEKNKEKEKQILWFITWREYLGDNKETKKLVNNIKYIINNREFNKFLKENNYKFKICLHQFFDENIISAMFVNKKNKIEIVYPKDIDVMDELIKSDMLITDYSSIGFDFTFLNKPVILYQPDLENYMKNRSFYCSTEEMEKYAIRTSKELVNTIVTNKYEINEFFKCRLPKNIDYEYVKEGKHIDDLYNDIRTIQNNKITFIGYNFYGIGGTVSATKAIAEGLLEKGYMVELLSLKKNKKAQKIFPSGLNVNNLYKEGSKRKKEKIKRLFVTDVWFSYLKDDKNKENLIPYVGYALKRKLNNIKSNTVVSTRESLHLFLKYAKSKNINNKLYFFHTDAKVLQETFPNVLKRLKTTRLENALFVTESNRKDYEENYSYNNYEKSIIIGNTLESKMCIPIEEIRLKDEIKQQCKGIILTRLSVDRKEDINNIIEFGKCLKERNKTNIVIDVYGKGDYLREFRSLLRENEIFNYIRYKGVLENPQAKILQSDFVLDLSNNQSFGMIYLEAIFNGKMVFCKPNIGSLETLKDIQKCYYNSYEELIEKIENVQNITEEELKANYKILSKKYSRENVANKFLEILK